jgi:hypothetical protein
MPAKGPVQNLAHFVIVIRGSTTGNTELFFQIRSFRAAFSIVNRMRSRIPK